MNSTTLARLVVATAVTGLALTGCAAGSSPTGSATPQQPGSASQTQHNDADVAFAQGMIPHHRQAVEMSEMALERSRNPQVTDLAQRIGAAQQPEIDTMTGWLREWGAEVPPAGSTGAMPGMDGMDHSGMDHRGTDGMSGMAGMMTPEQMGRLSQASGAEFDRMFLQSMIEHHRGALEMAEAELANGSDPRATALARTIIDTQQAEIDEMDQLLPQT
jgi:uncharacterized protein (DUF305 family)